MDNKDKRIAELFKDLANAPIGPIEEDFTPVTMKDNFTDMFIRTIAGHLVACGWTKSETPQEELGKWELVRTFQGVMSFNIYGVFRCSKCGHEKNFLIRSGLNFDHVPEFDPHCPNCGKELRGHKS